MEKDSKSERYDTILALTMEGQTAKQIDTKLNLAPGTAKRMKSSKAFKDALKEEYVVCLQDLIPIAFRRLSEILSDPDENAQTQLHAMKELFDLTGIRDNTVKVEPIEIMVKYG